MPSALAHRCGEECDAIVISNGERVCSVTGRVFGQVFVHAHQSVEEANAEARGGGAQKTGTAAWEEDGNDQDSAFAKEAAIRAEVTRVVKEVLGVRANRLRSGASASVSRASSALHLLEKHVATRGAVLSWKGASTVEAAAAVHNAKRASASEATVVLEAARACDHVARAVSACYALCSRAKDKHTRLPKPSVFAVAAVQIMAEGGITHAGTPLLPACARCAASVHADRCTLPKGVERQRAVTTAMRYIKNALSQALRAYGCATAVARQIERLS